MKYFGTDGIRGLVGQFPITVDFVLKLGWAVGQVLKSRGGDRVVIGKDTRISGYMFESALEAGLSAAGINIFLLGPIPTPAIAYLTGTLRAQLGIVISASHNPYEDNGIKFFSDAGMKLNDDFEQKIEELIDQPLVTVETAQVGKVYRVDDAHGRYIEYCKSALPHYTNFKSLKIVLDCANGATYSVAPNVFRELQADVINIYSHPNGTNINHHCGSTHPEFLQSRVMKEQADLGIAFDGDGDRVIMVDHLGEIVDGDELLYILAKRKLKTKQLQGGVIGTVMSNMGLEVALQELNIPFKRVKVGDKNIITALLEEKWKLGGETSGHIICLDATPTGDGIISALQVLRTMQDENKKLHELKKGMSKYPQVIKNFPCTDGDAIIANESIQKAIASAEVTLQGKGRILLRPSGTEPVIRLMIEGEHKDIVELLTNQLSHEIKQLIKNP